jgi:hypothetical protein
VSESNKFLHVRRYFLNLGGDFNRRNYTALLSLLLSHSSILGTRRRQGGASDRFQALTNTSVIIAHIFHGLDGCGLADDAHGRMCLAQHEKDFVDAIESVGSASGLVETALQSGPKTNPYLPR